MKPIMCRSAMLMTLLAAAISPACKKAAPPVVPLIDNLGDHHYAISSKVSLTQRYFNQGLRLYYAFNLAESRRAFEEAARQDPNCAICYWGVALSYGPNINAPLDRDSALAAYQALQKALPLQQHASEKEKALIHTLVSRYTANPPEDRAALDKAYADAMRDFAARYPDDLEGATLYAESLMNLGPWNYWAPDGTPREYTPEMLKQLERVIAASPNHPGANHFYIHAVEAVQPERAVVAAERLAALIPGAGHIVHMPGHIYIRVGRYADAIAANEHAVHADETYIQDQRPAPGPYTLGYYPHNYDFLAFAASLVGRSKQALGSTEKMLTLVPEDMVRQPGMSFAQHHLTRHLQMKIRFARWDDILKTPEPPADFLHARAMWNYARGRALAAQGKVADAEKVLAAVRAAAADQKLAPMRLEFNTSGQVLGLASEVLAGHIASAKKDFRAAITHMREAVRREDSFNYGEPPEWTIPVRQEFGVILLQARQGSGAEKIFREDLKRFPDNGWSLHGLEQALRAQGRGAQADEVAAQFQKAWASSDGPIPETK